jgi:hypothetical protein
MSVKLATLKSEAENYINLCETQFADWKLPLGTTIDRIVLIGASLINESCGSTVPFVATTGDEGAYDYANATESSGCTTYATAQAGRAISVISNGISGSRLSDATTNERNNFASRLKDAMDYYTSDDTLFVVHAGGDTTVLLPYDSSEAYAAQIAGTEAIAAQAALKPNRVIICSHTFRDYRTNAYITALPEDDRLSYFFDNEIEASQGFWRRYRSYYDAILTGNLYNFTFNRHTGLLDTDGLHIRGRATTSLACQIFANYVVDQALQYINGTMTPIAKRSAITDMCVLRCGSDENATNQRYTITNSVTGVDSATDGSTTYKLYSPTGHYVCSVLITGRLKSDDTVATWVTSADGRGQGTAGNTDNHPEFYNTENANIPDTNEHQKKYFFFGANTYATTHFTDLEPSTNYRLTIACNRDVATGTRLCRFFKVGDSGNFVDVDAARNGSHLGTLDVTSESDGTLTIRSESSESTVNYHYINAIQIEKL